MSKQLKSIYPEAVIRETETVKKMRLIDSPDQVEAGLSGLLRSDGKPILVCKGGTCPEAQVYIFLANQRDKQGEPVFKFSKRHRGLVAISKTWGGWEKVTGAALLSYLNEHFVPCQLVTNASTGKALLLLDSFPVQFTGVLMQTRVSGQFNEMFEWVD
jgi:hypothetical protein